MRSVSQPRNIGSMANGDDDFLALAALASLGSGGRAGQHLSQPAADDDAEDLSRFIEMGARPKRNGNGLIAARAAKTTKRLRAEAEKANDTARKATASLETIAFASPALFKGLALGTEPRRKRNVVGPELRALAQTKVAFAPKKLCGSFHRRVHARAACVVASYLESIQKQCVIDMLALAPNRLDGGRVSQRIHIYSHQWDETSQLLRALGDGKETSSLKRSHGQHRVEVIVQHGGMWCFEWDGSVLAAQRHEPYFIKPMTIVNTKADSLVEALLRFLPINLLDATMMRQYANNCDVMVLTWGCDRASSNISALRWFCGMVKTLPPSLLTHAEPCNAHGASLAKGRARMSAALAAALVSYSKLLRDGRTTDALRNCTAKLISDTLEVRRERRPEVFN